MAGMTINERIKHIEEISGLKEPVIRRVLDASRQSAIESLKVGESANIIGICTLIPNVTVVLNKDGSLGKKIRVKTRISSVIDKALDYLDGEYEESNKEPSKFEDVIDVHQLKTLI